MKKDKLELYWGTKGYRITDCDCKCDLSGYCSDCGGRGRQLEFEARLLQRLILQIKSFVNLKLFKNETRQTTLDFLEN